MPTNFNQPIVGQANSFMYPQQNALPFLPVSAAPTYMMMVEGEVGAKAWQMPTNLAPNTIIPLWDVDGEHVYFRSVDNYGRPNPMRKGKIIMEDEPAQETTQYVTKEEFEEFKNFITKSIGKNNRHYYSKKNQNGNENRGDEA